MHGARRAARVAAVIAVGLAACRSATDTAPLAPLPPSGDVPAEFHTDRTQYTIGSVAKLTMVNRSAFRFTMGVCNDVLEYEATAGWVEIPPPNTACIALALLIAPNDSAMLQFDLKQAKAAGTYRVRRRLTVEQGVGVTAYLRTNTFSVTR